MFCCFISTQNTFPIFTDINIFLCFRLATYCEIKAHGYKYFSLRFYGICVGLNDLSKLSSNEECYSPDYQACQDNDVICVGGGFADMVYEVGTFMIPLYIYIYYVYICVCVCMCVYVWEYIRVSVISIHTTQTKKERSRDYTL